MFFSSLHTPLVTLVAYFAVVSASPLVSTPPCLTVEILTPDLNIDGLENLKVTMTIVNTGGEPLEFLNNPHRVLDPFPKNTFTITTPSGSGSPRLFGGACRGYA